MADTTVETSQKIANATAAGKSEKKQPGFFQRANDRIAVFITSIVGTMWCAYAFSIMVLIPLQYPNTLSAVQFISSAFLQLVLLPLIMVGQNVLSRASEERAKKDHKMIRLELQEIKDMIEENKKIHAILDEIQTKLK